MFSVYDIQLINIVYKATAVTGNVIDCVINTKLCPFCSYRSPLMRIASGVLIT